MESVLNPDSKAEMEVTYANYYESSSLDVYFEMRFPSEDGAEPERTYCYLLYRPKDCFIADTVNLPEVQWEEWNYVTTSGDKVLIMRSDDYRYSADRRYRLPHPRCLQDTSIRFDQ